MEDATQRERSHVPGDRPSPVQFNVLRFSSGLRDRHGVAVVVGGGKEGRSLYLDYLGS